jgi:hypothetical protein
VLRNVLPYLITALIIGWILRKHSALEIARRMNEGHALLAFAVGFALPVVLLGLVSKWDQIVIGACAGLPYLEVVRGKAATSILQTFGYGAGQGAYGVWIARKTGLGARLSAGIVFYIVAGDVAGVCLVASLSMWLGGVPGPAGLRFGVPAAVLIVIACIVLASFSRGRRDRFFSPWRIVAPTTGVLVILGRALNICIMVVFFFLAQRAFGLHIPFGAVASYLPVLLVIAALPVNVAGFGAAQLAWLQAFAPWADGPSILAFQFVVTLGMGAATVARGLPFMKRVVTEIDEGSRARLAEGVRAVEHRGDDQIAGDVGGGAKATEQPVHREEHRQLGER